MNKRKKLVVKYCAFNSLTHEFYLCLIKVDLAKCCKVSTRTILRRIASNNDFMLNEWYVSINVEVIKQPIRNVNGFT